MEHFVIQRSLTIVNTTLPNHFFHPGEVYRSVYSNGFSISIRSEGQGYGRLAVTNRLSAPTVWWALAFKVRQWIKQN